ncbi:MAG: hypothetical protein P8L77_05930 [Gammaproteobacteria bacterium]|nr:hypothetical protein [Gammaproteobacteria bacterium]
MTKEIILQSAAAGIAGYQLSKLYHAQTESKQFGDRSRRIYESIVSCYKDNINSEIPAEWQIEKLSTGAIRPSNTMKDINTLSGLITILEKAKVELDKNLTSDVQGHKSEMINSIVIYLKVILTRHTDCEHNMSKSSFKHISGTMPQEARLDGPELMFITEFSLALLKEPMETSQEVKKRLTYFDNFLRGPISEHENKHKNPFSTLQGIQNRIINIHSILTVEENDRKLPNLLDNLINSILLLNNKVISLIYSCSLGSKKRFSISRFMSDDEESIEVIKHRSGLALYLMLKELGFKNAMNPDKITKENINEINRSILSKISLSKNNPFSAKLSGIRSFIKEDQHEAIYSDITDLLRDVAFLYYHTKILKSMKKSLPILGIQWGLKDDNSNTAIQTMIKITQLAHQRLRTNSIRFNTTHQEKITLHKNNSKHHSLDLYDNPGRGITDFNDYSTKSEGGVTKLVVSISENIKRYQDLQFIIDEKVAFLNNIFNSTLHCIQLEENYTQEPLEEFSLVRQKLIKALETLPSDVYLEQQSTLRPPNTQAITLPIQSNSIAEISDIMTKPNTTFALRNIVTDNYQWRSEVLKEIYNKIIKQHQWALHRWEWVASCWGTYNNESFIKFYDIINTMIRLIENTHATTDELNALDYIVQAYVQRNQANFFKTPPTYTEKAMSIRSNETKDGCLIIQSENSSCRVPINLLTLEFKNFFSSYEGDGMTEAIRKKKEDVSQLRSGIDELKEKNERLQMELSEIETLRAI